MEVTDDLLLGLFEAWRTEIDSAPFTHEAECDKIVRALLGGHGYPYQKAVARDS